MSEVDQFRVSNAERESIVARLTVATSDGRLTLEEFEDRAARAFTARTWAELAVLVEDLPAPPPTDAAPPAPGQINVLALISMIVGIVSVLPMFSFGMPPLGVVAIVLGILGRNKAKRDRAGKSRMALAGIICGSIGVALEIAMVAVGIILGD